MKTNTTNATRAEKTGLTKFDMMWMLCVLPILASCGSAPVIGGPVRPAELKDGIYRGCDAYGPNKAVVEVEIRNREIAQVRIIQHNAWKGKKADPIIPRYIVLDQSTAVDAVSGATNSSHVIMNAAQKAILESYKAGRAGNNTGK
jgi:fumarate reductase flavoprotein subunit